MRKSRKSIKTFHIYRPRGWWREEGIAFHRLHSSFYFYDKATIHHCHTWNMTQKWCEQHYITRNLNGCWELRGNHIIRLTSFPPENKLWQSCNSLFKQSSGLFIFPVKRWSLKHEWTSFLFVDNNHLSIWRRELQSCWSFSHSASSTSFCLFCGRKLLKVLSHQILLKEELGIKDSTFLIDKSKENHMKIRTNLVRSLPKPNSV